MTARLSTGLVNKLMDTASFKDIFSNCVVDIYSGTQPTTADDAVSGTLLGTLTKSSGAYTAETKATGTVTLATGASGSVNTVTVNSIDVLGTAVSFNTSLTQTAADVAAQINRNPKNLLFVASSVGAVVTITAENGLGTTPNTWVVSATLTTITASYANMSGGVDAVNGLRLDTATAGAVAKVTADTWSATAMASGTAGWFRMRESGDTGTAATTTAARYDGAIATTGAQMNLGTLTIVSGAPVIISGVTFTMPQA